MTAGTFWGSPRTRQDQAPKKVSATSLTTALVTAFLAERIALFAIVMGVALLLTGIGFPCTDDRRPAPRRATEPTPQAA